MGKTTVHLYIEYSVLERAKLNNINLSKELEDHLIRLLSIKTYSTPTEKEEIDKELKEKEIKLIEITKELNALKSKKQTSEEQEGKRKEELSRWRKI